MTTIKKIGFWVAAGILLMTIPSLTPARADEPVATPQAPDNTEPDRLEKLQEQIESLQGEVKQLREQAEARKKLELTSEEKQKKEEEILSAAGQQYTLKHKGSVGLEYNLDYTYYSSDTINVTTITITDPDTEQRTTHTLADIEQHANHTLTNSIFIDYGLLDNLTFNTNLPFVYKYDRTGTDDGKELTDIGDVSVGFQYQPLKTTVGKLAAILYGGYTIPTGRSPYEINIATELPSGNGYASARLGVSLSKTVDPVVVYGNLSYAHNFDAEGLNQSRRVGEVTMVLHEVDPGDQISLGLGFGYAMSYNVSLNLGYQYTHRSTYTYSWTDGSKSESGDTASSLVTIGTGWRYSPSTSLYMKVGIGLTNNDPDFIFSLRIPFNFS